MNTSYTLIRSKKSKKSTAMNIDSQGKIIVRAPMHTSITEIENFIKSHSDWIKKQIKQFQTYSQTQKKFTTGELLPYKGQVYPLSINKSSRKTPKVNFHQDLFTILEPSTLSGSDRQSQLRQSLRKWYIKQARDQITQEVDHYTQLMNQSYNQIRIKETS